MQALSSVSSKSGLDIGTLLSGGTGGGGGNQLMGMVMKEASSAIGGGSSDDKQSMMNGAAMTLTKLVAQNQLSSFIGGSNSGGLGMLGMGATVRVYCIRRVHRFDAFHVATQEPIWMMWQFCSQCILYLCL